MKSINIKARIKRNKFDELAGKYYQDENSEIIDSLKKENKKALLGIKRDDGVYTIIGEESIYYKTESGVNGEMSHEEFINVLTKNALAKGKTGQFEYIIANEQDSVWLLNAETMNAMWNTILLLYDNRDNVSK